MKSIVQTIGAVSFPAFMAERVYMREFTKAKGLPSDLKRWQPTVDQMLDGVDTDGPIYIMVDQKIVEPNGTHRRPGMHLDGYWNAAAGRHQRPGGHITDLHNLQASAWENQKPWNAILKPGQTLPHEALILASDVVGCRALLGEWEGVIGEGGDVSHLDLSHMDEFVMQANIAYAGNVTMLHESIALPVGAQRSLVRLSVPGFEVH